MLFPLVISSASLSDGYRIVPESGLAPETQLTVMLFC